MVETTDEDGNVYLSCPDGGVVQSVGGKTVCATKASAEIMFFRICILKTQYLKYYQFLGLNQNQKKIVIKKQAITQMQVWKW